MSFCSFQVKEATKRYGYCSATTEWLTGTATGDYRTENGGSIIAVEKKMPRREELKAAVPSGGGGFVEVRIMIYIEKHAVAVCIFDRKSDDGHGTRSDGGHCNHYGNLFNDDAQWVYAAGDIATIDELEKVLRAPLEYGLSSKHMVYSRNGAGDIAEKWSAGPLQGRPEASCSSCGKRGLHVGAAAERQLMGGVIDDNDPIMRACSRCCRESYCSRSCQKKHWRKHKKKCKDRAHFDGAVRWGIVAIAGGLTTDPAEVSAIRDVCNQFDSLLFEDGAPPSLAHARLSCGSCCALTAMILRIGKRFHKVQGFADVKEAMAVLSGVADRIEDCYLGFPPCQKSPTFCGMYKKEMTKLEKSILALRPAVRAELIHWFFEVRMRDPMASVCIFISNEAVECRAFYISYSNFHLFCPQCAWNTVLQKLQCDNRLTMVTSEHVPLTREEMFPVHFALMDYSRLVHGKFDTRVYCGVHGTIELGREEEDDDDEEEEDDDGLEISFADLAKEAMLARNLGPSYERDIRSVMAQADYCSRAKAVDALISSKGDIVEATMKIMEERRKNESNDIDDYENVD